MKDLIEVLIAQIKTKLPYLHWVEPIESILVPDGFPNLGVGVKDGESVFASQPGRKDIRVDTVTLYCFQSLVYDKPGVTIIGEQSIGDDGKGLLQIAEDLRTALNDNKLADKVLYAHVDSIGESQTAAEFEGDKLLQYKPVKLTYRRYVS